jgi:ATPase family AAA domain-containing protein 1
MGILLYGPPGCGKTLLAKAIAKDANLRFLVLPLSLVLDKWVGETEKYLEALFTLARKIKPCVIFIDEIDSLTRRRNPLDRDWNLTMKSHFLSLWDGIVSSELNSHILVIIALIDGEIVSQCRFSELLIVNLILMMHFCVACLYK